MARATLPSFYVLLPIFVLGGFGLFGRAAMERLRADGLAPVALSRRTGVDAENGVSLRAALRPGASRLARTRSRWRSCALRPGRSGGSTNATLRPRRYAGQRTAAHCDRRLTL